MEEAETGEELVHLRTAESTEARTLVRSLARRIGSLEDRMTRNESVIDHMCQVQHNQLAAFKDVTRNLNRLIESLARLDVNEMKREMVGAMRDMMREESVAQLCAQRPGPSAREPPPEYPRVRG